MKLDKETMSEIQWLGFTELSELVAAVKPGTKIYKVESGYNDMDSVNVGDADGKLTFELARPCVVIGDDGNYVIDFEDIPRMMFGEDLDPEEVEKIKTLVE